MHVVHIPRRFVTEAWGGTETVVLETSKGLLRRGHCTSILCPNALASTDTESIEGVPVSRVPYFYPYWRLSAEARRQLDQTGGNLFSFALLHTLKRYPQLDLIHLHTAKRLGGIGRYVAHKRHIPYVVSLHGGVHAVPAAEVERQMVVTSGAIEWGKMLGWWVGSRRVLDDAAAILCVGQEEQRLTQRRLPQANVLYVPNGVDPGRFVHGNGLRFRRKHGIDARARVVLTMGRIDPQKNQCLPVRLLPSLRQAIPDIHVLLIGPVTNDAYGQELRQTIDAMGLAPHVTLIPGLCAAAPELVDAYHAADLFLLPSIHEPFGVVVLEAWAAGLPVVASRVGGLPGFVCDGEDGFLCDLPDDRAFCQAVQALLTDTGLKRRVALAGQRKAREQFSWDSITDRCIRIYDDVIATYRRR